MWRKYCINNGLDEKRGPCFCGLRFFVVQEIMLFDLLQAGFPM